MDLKTLKQYVKELMGAMVRSDIKRLALKHGDLEIELEREEHSSGTRIIHTPTEEDILPHHYPHGLRAAPLPSVAPVSAEEPSHVISSPMVGTFYTAPGPDEPVFVKVGDSVHSDDVVCIIEAMKVMNEIKAGVTGTIVEILVENGHPVEFGTKLFKVR